MCVTWPTHHCWHHSTAPPGGGHDARHYQARGLRVPLSSLRLSLSLSLCVCVWAIDGGPARVAVAGSSPIRVFVVSHWCTAGVWAASAILVVFEITKRMLRRGSVCLAFFKKRKKEFEKTRAVRHWHFAWAGRVCDRHTHHGHLAAGVAACVLTLPRPDYDTDAGGQLRRDGDEFVNPLAYAENNAMATVS